MNEFKSFEDFRKEQHDSQSNRSEPEDRDAPGSDDGSSRDADLQNLSGRYTLHQPKIDLSEYPEQPRKNPHHKGRRHRANKIRLFLVLFAVFIVIAAAALLFLPIPFGTLQVTGSKEVTYDDVLFEGQIRQPVNVLQISSSDLKKRLENDLRVASATVVRTSPFSMTVAIEDREPIAIIQGEFGYYFIDKTGLVIRQAATIKNGNLPMVTGKKIDNLLLGDHVDDQDINKALIFLNHLSPEGEKVFSEINIGNTNNILAYTRDGITVKLGSGEDMAGQAELAENMVGDVKARNLSVEYIQADLSSPYIKLKK